MEDFDKETEEAVVLLAAILAEVLTAVIRLLIIRLGLRLSFSMELSSTILVSLVLTRRLKPASTWVAGFMTSHGPQT